LTRLPTPCRTPEFRPSDSGRCGRGRFGSCDGARERGDWAVYAHTDLSQRPYSKTISVSVRKRETFERCRGATSDLRVNFDS
jgi:hypothetical protein